MAREIFWIDVVERAPDSLSGEKVIMSYPFPDIPISKDVPSDIVNTFTRTHPQLAIESFPLHFDQINDGITKLCNETRFHYICNLWHNGKFLRVNIRDWKYG